MKLFIEVIQQQPITVIIHQQVVIEVTLYSSLQQAHMAGTSFAGRPMNEAICSGITDFSFLLAFISHSTATIISSSFQLSVSFLSFSFFSLFLATSPPSVPFSPPYFSINNIRTQLFFLFHLITCRHIRISMIRSMYRNGRKQDGVSALTIGR